MIHFVREHGIVDRDVNPARAGMIPMMAHTQEGTMGKPRASEDDPRFLYADTDSMQ